MSDDFKIGSISGIRPGQQVDNFDYIEESLERRSKSDPAPKRLDMSNPPQTTQEQWDEVRSLFYKQTAEMNQQMLAQFEKKFKEVEKQIGGEQ